MFMLNKMVFSDAGDSGAPVLLSIVKEQKRAKCIGIARAHAVISGNLRVSVVRLFSTRGDNELWQILVSFFGGFSMNISLEDRGVILS